MAIPLMVLAPTAVGMAVASLSIKLIHDVARLTPIPGVRRAWLMLAGIVGLCILLQVASLCAKLNGQTKLDAMFLAWVHLLGPVFGLTTACLARRTVRDLLRIPELEQAASVDPLTQLPNRRAFDKSLQSEMRACRKAGRTLHLVLLDLDHFKQVNDRFGHPVGDMVLREVAVVIRDSFPAAAQACRLGGEEFAVIVGDLSTPKVLAAVERARDAVERAQLDLPQGARAQVTASLGAAPMLEGDTVESLMARADAALYAAKRAGRNRISLAAA